MQERKATMTIVVPICLAILIVGILAGFLFSANHSGTADRSRAECVALNLRNSVTNYFTEYHAYPVRDEADDITIDSSRKLMGILLGSESEIAPTGRNPRNIAFFATDKSRFPDGRLFPDYSGELWDPWGNFYRVRFDANGDGQVESPEFPGTVLPESILVWSAGKDGDFDTWADNVKTW